MNTIDPVKDQADVWLSCEESGKGEVYMHLLEIMERHPSWSSFMLNGERCFGKIFKVPKEIPFKHYIELCKLLDKARAIINKTQGDK